TLSSISSSLNDPATTEIYTLSLHDALPIFRGDALRRLQVGRGLLHVADLEIQEREPLERPHVVGGDPQRHVPFVEGALEVVLVRSEEHTSELQSLAYLVCRLLLEKKKKQ